MLSLAARACSGRTEKTARKAANARPATPCPQCARSIQYVISASPSWIQLATLPTSAPSRVIARDTIDGEPSCRAMRASNSARSEGSSEVNAAIRTDSGSRIWSNSASRSSGDTARSATSDHAATMP